jgi:hypothetical protein
VTPPQEPARRLVIDPKARRQARYVWAAAAVLLALNGLTYVELRYAWQKTRYWQRVDTSMTLHLDIRTDPWRAGMTNAVLEYGCEVGHLTECTPADSQVVEALRKETLPTMGRKLLSQFSYSSAYHLLEDLSLRGADQEVLELTANPGFDADSLARFAGHWYLYPATEYAVHGRESDALALFRNFLGLMRHAVQRGDWISLPGVDATDLPVLADVFCNVPDHRDSELCLIGILKALSRAGVEQLPYGIHDFSRSVSE